MHTEEQLLSKAPTLVSSTDHQYTVEPVRKRACRPLSQVHVLCVGNLQMYVPAMMVVLGRHKALMANW